MNSRALNREAGIEREGVAASIPEPIAQAGDRLPLGLVVTVHWRYVIDSPRPRVFPMPCVHQELIDTVQAMNRSGINQGTAGNASVRLDDGMLITPSGIPYERLTPDDLVRMTLEGEHHCPNQHPPSSEWRFHCDLLRTRDDLGALVHTHGRAAGALACLRRGLPAFHYMVAVAGGTDVRCAPYATFGTAELSQHVLEAMRGRRACLLANHGLLAGGTSLAQALAIASEIEALCDMYCRALGAGEPVLLSEPEMNAVIDQFDSGLGAGPALGVER